MKRFLCILLALSLFSFVGCQNNGPKNVSPEKSKNIYENGLHDIQISYSDQEFITGGKSDYKIVIPFDADTDEQTAANEFNYFYSLAVGEKLPQTEDTQVSFTSESKYIFIGDVKQAEGILSVSFKEMGKSGYRIITKDKSIFILGGTSRGTIYGIYCFLENIFGYKYYSADEYKINSVSDMNLPLINITEKPDFAYREANYGEILNDSVLRMRMRYDYTNDMYFFGYDCHNSFDVIPKYVNTSAYEATKDKGYFLEHRNWFSNDPGASQLCYSNEEMIAEYIKNLKLLIAERGTDKVVLMGQEDNHAWCTCELCTASKNKYGVDSAVMVNFVNRVSEEINEWMKTAYPNADPLNFIVFAYYATNDAPVIETENGFKPTAPEMKFNEYSGIMYAVPMDYQLTFQDEKNANYYEQLKRWSVITDRIHYWGYTMYSWEYMVPFNEYGVMQDNYITLLENNVSSIYMQCKNGQHNSPGFGHLHAFLQSRLKWNVNEDVAALTDEFFENYFKDANEAMRKYYDEMRAWYNTLYETTDVEGYWGFAIVQTKYWPKSVLEQWMIYINEALQSIEHYRNANPVLYTKLYDRINLESMSIRYLLLQLYRNTYTNVQKMQIINKFYEDFDYLGISQVSEQADTVQSITMDSLWESWGIA